MALGVGVPSWLSSNSRASSGGGGTDAPASPSWSGAGGTSGVTLDPTKLSPYSGPVPQNHTSNWVTGTTTPRSSRGSYYENQAFPTTGDPNAATPVAPQQQPGYGTESNPFDPTAAYALQLHWLENQLGRGQAQVGAHGELLNAQANNLNQQYGFNEREGDLKLRAGAADRTLIDKSRLNIDQLRALYGEQQANEIAGLNQKADVNRRDINSKATAAGAWFFPGRGQHLTDVNNDLANATQNVELSTRQKLLNLDDRGNELENRSAKLDLLGQEVGLDRDKAKAALEFGMAQLGYDRFLDSNKLLDMIDNKNSSQYDLVMNLVNQAMKLGVGYQSGALGNQYAQYTGGQ